MIADPTGARRRDALPLTYDECRARFRHAAATAGAAVAPHAIAARGPFGQQLTIDLAALGPAGARRALVVLSGVHGVEGFVCSALQADLLARLKGEGLPADLGVLFVHAVNPWGMAHGRRQNESSVDLNRNWARSDRDPPHNEAYDEVHPIACPDDAELPDVDALLARAGPIVEARGQAWVRDAITTGQYRHADGLHYGGRRTEEANEILAGAVPRYLAEAERVLVADLHTGHGPWGELTVLSDRPPGSDQDRFLRARFDCVEATADNPEATTRPKSGPIARGLADMVDHAEVVVATAEVGTTDDMAQLAATYQEQWVHNHGDPTRADHAAARWAYRCCFTPDDPAWEAAALDQGGRFLDAAVAATAGTGWS